MAASHTVQRTRIDGQYNECTRPKRDKDNVGHSRTPVVYSRQPISAADQISIGKSGHRHKEKIKKADRQSRGGGLASANAAAQTKTLQL